MASGGGDGGDGDDPEQHVELVVARQAPVPGSPGQHVPAQPRQAPHLEPQHEPQVMNPTWPGQPVDPETYITEGALHRLLAEAVAATTGARTTTRETGTVDPRALEDWTMAWQAEQPVAEQN